MLLISIEVPFLQSGSSHKQVPSIDVFGSYFPAWLISLAAGILLTVVVSAVGGLIDIRPSGFLRFIVDVSLILIFSVSVWFWFFAG
jgi:YtcA family